LSARTREFDAKFVGVDHAVREYPVRLRRKETVTTSRRIDIDKIIKDLKTGDGDVPVMEKYGLTPREIIVIKQTFLPPVSGEDAQPQERQGDAITLPEFSDRRAMQRREPFYQINILDESDSKNIGTISDIHTQGLATANLIVQTGQAKTLVIRSKPFNIYATFRFKARCRWSTVNESGAFIAGFQITDISRGAVSELTRLIDHLTVPPEDVVMRKGRVVRKKSISAKQALSDISSGLDDSALMRKYNLAPEGLQSLFDKLISGGFITLADLQERMPGFLDTVVISGPSNDKPDEQSPVESRPAVSKTEAWKAALEAAADVKAGLDDFALMSKYRLSAKGLRSVFDKLIALGLLTQADIDERDLECQSHTVTLSVNEFEFGAELECMGPNKP
jgi:hypothetical protein